MKQQETFQERLDTLRTDPGWTEASTIAYARSYLETLQQECGDSWREPLFVHAVPFGDNEVCCEWFCEPRKVTLYIREPIENWREQWGEKPDNEVMKMTKGEIPQIEDAPANTPEERAAFWRWLWEEQL